MREVINLVPSCGGVHNNNNNSQSDDSNNNNTSDCAIDEDVVPGAPAEAPVGTDLADPAAAPESDTSPIKMLSSQPGYLELSEDRVKELLCDRTIEELYEVEDQPFARGKYATVRRCRCRRTGQQFAAKLVRKRRRSADLRAEILHEVAVLDACRGCPRIVRLHRVFESPNDMVLLLELAAGGELQMVLDRDEVPEEREVARLMRQILNGLVYLHDINVAHLDLKPQNLVLTGEFPDCDVKLCDFGISRYLSEGADVREILGTPDYVAPEVLNYEPISLATDMWSVGVLLYVLLTGCSPFGGETKQETFCNISQCRLDFPDDLFEDVSDHAKDLMRKLIVKDPKHRLSASECLQHYWFTSQEPLGPHLILKANATPTPAPLSPSTPTTPTTPTTPPPSSPISTTSTSPTSPRRSMSVCTALGMSRSLSTPLSRRLADSLDSLDCLDSQANGHSTPRSERSGISATRRNTFLRNMESIAKRLSVAGDADVDADADVEGPPRIASKVAPPLPASSSPSPSSSSSPSPPLRTARSTARATAMQTMPVRGLARAFEVRASSSSSTVPAFASSRTAGLVAMGLTGLATSAVDLRSDGTAKDKEAIFKFRKVFVLEDVDVEDADALPMSSINGSTGSGSSVYSDTSISDSNSDTVSELSVDSSSDRSSIISLDHDEQYPWDVAYARLGLGRLCHPSYNVWERAQGQTSRSRTLYPRECTGSFARALSRFATEDKHGDRARAAPQGMPMSVSSKPILSKLALMQTMSNARHNRCGLELMREKNGNLVVIREIREVKPGGRYARFSEVKCESVQSRIRKLQVQGAKS